MPILLVIISCNGNRGAKDVVQETTSEAAIQKTEDVIYKISVGGPELQTEDIRLSEICSTIRYIPLETGAESLISNIRFVEMIPQGFYVASGDQVRLFDTDGRFVRNIGAPGNGPGEYNVVGDIAVDRSDNSLFLINILGRKVMHFGIDGALINDFVIDQALTADQIEVGLSGEIYLTFSDMVQSSETDEALFVAVYSSEGELTAKFNSGLEMKQDGGARLMIPNEVLYRRNNDIYARQVRGDTLFRFSGMEQYPYVIFDMGSLKMPLEMFTYQTFMKRLYGKDYIYFQDIVDCDRYLFITFKYQDSFYRSCFSKLSGEIRYASIVEGKGVITDDLNAGIPFWPESVYDNERLIGWVEPVNLSPEQRIQAGSPGSPVNISDNPVLQVAMVIPNL